MSVDFTVAIPTYNGAARLPLVLDRLRSQLNTDPITWEILVIDNNSTDNTAQIVKHHQTNWPTAYPLKYCFEAQQGAAFARQLAVRTASGEWIAFLDDDNLPAPDWLAEAHAFSKAYPQAGAYSGQIHGEFEVVPPQNFEKIQAYLAIREHGPEPHRFNPAALILPPAASLMVRKRAWLESVPSHPSLTGKLPGLLVQGEDYEPLLHIHKQGWEIWYAPKIHTYHQIPRQRLERIYLLTLARGCGLATCHLLMVNAQPWQIPVILIRTLLGNIRRIALQSIKYRGRLKTELIPAFEMAFFWGSLISPFFYLRRQFWPSY